MFQANIIFPYSISELLKCIYLCFYFDTPLAAVTWSFSSQWDKPRMILFDINVPRWHFADECQYDIISPHPGALISTDYIQSVDSLYTMSILPIGVEIFFPLWTKVVDQLTYSQTESGGATQPAWLRTDTVYRRLEADEDLQLTLGGRYLLYMKLLGLTLLWCSLLLLANMENRTILSVKSSL